LDVGLFGTAEREAGVSSSDNIIGSAGEFGSTSVFGWSCGG